MIHQKLKSLRKQKGVSQEEVAKALNVQQHTYSGWETGKHQISIDKISEICHFYQIEPTELFNSSINQVFNDKVQNGYINHVENLHNEATETISLLLKQNENLQQTISIVKHQLDSMWDFIKSK